MRVAVTGGRDFEDVTVVRLALSKIPAEATLVHGAARGADSLSAYIWSGWGRAVEAHPADWVKHGKAAGPIRNQEMLDSGVDLLLAFPGGKGTADMISRCRKAGVPVAHAGDYEFWAGSNG